MVLRQRQEGEEALHTIFREAFRRRRGLSGPGHDCARVNPPTGAPLLVSTDQLVLGVHAEEDVSPGQLARKLLRRTLSDLAAAGAQPWAVTWTIAAPREKGQAWMKRLARAFLEEAENFGCSVIGGDISNSPAVVLTCTALGKEGRRRNPGRGGAKAGDWLCVTGRLGGAVQSGRHLKPEPRLTEGRALVQRYRAKAMMDLSDGLARDLPRLLEASEVGAQIELDALPLSRGLKHNHEGWQAAVGEGEDYELLVALRPGQAKRALQDPLLKRIGFHIIGEITAERGLRWLLDAKEYTLPLVGWGHDWNGS